MKRPELPLTEEQRGNVINLLVDDWLNTIATDRAGEVYIREWLTSGRIGYNEHDDQELIDLAEDAGLFDEETEDDEA